MLSDVFARFLNGFHSQCLAVVYGSCVCAFMCGYTYIDINTSIILQLLIEAFYIMRAQIVIWSLTLELFINKFRLFK